MELINRFPVSHQQIALHSLFYFYEQQSHLGNVSSSIDVLFERVLSAYLEHFFRFFLRNHIYSVILNNM